MTEVTMNVEKKDTTSSQSQKGNRITISKQAQELMGMHAAIEEVMQVALDPKTTYWLSRNHSQIEAKFKSIKKQEDVLIEKFHTKEVVGRDGAKKFFVEKSQTPEAGKEIDPIVDKEIRDNYEAFVAEIKKLHTSNMEVEIFTIPASSFVSLNPDMKVFIGSYWSLLSDVFTGQESPEMEELMSYDQSEKTPKSSLILT